MNMPTALATAAALAVATVCAEQARLSLYCLSLRVNPARTQLLGETYSAEFAGPGGEPANGELLPLYADAGYSHGSVLRLEMPNAFEPVYLELMVDLPPWRDDNRNTLHDFFEVGQGIDQVKVAGAYRDLALGRQSAVIATWSREAKSNLGQLELKLSNLGLVFQHTFELLQLEGTFTYTREPPLLVGQVELARPPSRRIEITGPIRFHRSGPDRLSLAPGAWTNALGQVLNYEAMEPLDRHETEFIAYAEFADGAPETVAADYWPWIVILSDEGDGDGDGIPDISDEPPPTPRTSLALQREGNGLRFTVLGEEGKVFDLEFTHDLGSPVWRLQRAIRLKENPTIVSIKAPNDPVTFWRLTPK